MGLAEDALGDRELADSWSLAWTEGEPAPFHVEAKPAGDIARRVHRLEHVLGETVRMLGGGEEQDVAGPDDNRCAAPSAGLFAYIRVSARCRVALTSSASTGIVTEPNEARL